MSTSQQPPVDTGNADSIVKCWLLHSRTSRVWLLPTCETPVHESRSGLCGTAYVKPCTHPIKEANRQAKSGVHSLEKLEKQGQLPGYIRPRSHTLSPSRFQCHYAGYSQFMPGCRTTQSLAQGIKFQWGQGSLLAARLPSVVRGSDCAHRDMGSETFAQLDKQGTEALRRSSSYFSETKASGWLCLHGCLILRTKPHLHLMFETDCSSHVGF